MPLTYHSNLCNKLPTLSVVAASGLTNGETITLTLSPTGGTAET